MKGASFTRMGINKTQIRGTKNPRLVFQMLSKILILSHDLQQHTNQLGTLLPLSKAPFLDLKTEVNKFS